jgi:predicted nucleic acid-binding protein
MRPIVIDANIALALLLKRPWSEAAEQAFVRWKREKVALFAPAVWPAELASAIRKSVFVQVINPDDALIAISRLPLLNVSVQPPDAQLLQASLRWADRLGQMVAYDAQYISLAEHLKASFWTADRKLYQRCQQLAVDFVFLLEY